MFNSSKAAKPSTKIDTLIGVGTCIVGDVTFSGGLRVDGEIHGNVTADPSAPSTLTISEHATVEGTVSVSHVVINGVVIGPISAREFCELQSHARVTGDIEYSAIEIHLGAVVQGRLVHQGQGKSVELKLAANNG
jgi:cytoskeletal protein CcmA (bactofilin family)